MQEPAGIHNATKENYLERRDCLKKGGGWGGARRDKKTYIEGPPKGSQKIAEVEPLELQLPSMTIKRVADSHHHGDSSEGRKTMNQAESA